MIAQPVVPEPELGGGSDGPCSDYPSVIAGRYDIFSECRTEPGLFWRVESFGPIEMTAPLFDFFGDQQLHGHMEIDLDQQVHGSSEIDGDQQVHGYHAVDEFIELRPSLEPPFSPAPPVGEPMTARIWFAGGHLKVKYTEWVEGPPGEWVVNTRVADIN